jgi:DNA-binding response OmpR family regulator
MTVTMSVTTEAAFEGGLVTEQPNPLSGYAIPMVLVVDDDCEIRQLVAMSLRRHGLNVTTAGDGVEALAMIGLKKPDLMLLDIMMPRLDGFGVLEDLRALDHQMPVVLLSALSRPSDVSHGLELGANDYIIKPFTRVDLLERVCKYVDTSHLEVAGAAMHELAVLAAPLDAPTVIPTPWS